MFTLVESYVMGMVRSYVVIGSGIVYRYMRHMS
jgi:hypothetical protein